MAITACYQHLSSSHPVQGLNAAAAHFGELLVGLELMRPEMWTITPKLHLLMEIGMEGSSPSLAWTYREEDFGGFLAGVARRRGGRESALATSRTTLQAFKLKQDMPCLREAGAQ
eukprot:380672-Amphidinium_carterae.1